MFGNSPGNKDINSFSNDLKIACDTGFLGAIIVSSRIGRKETGGEGAGCDPHAGQAWGKCMWGSGLRCHSAPRTHV